MRREDDGVRLSYQRKRDREHRNRQRRQGPYPVDRPISDPETVVANKQLAVLLLQKLTIREQAVVDFITREDFTLEDCGNRLGIGRERVRQIREKAFRKMRYVAEKQLKLKPEDLFA